MTKGKRSEARRAEAKVTEQQVFLFERGRSSQTFNSKKGYLMHSGVDENMER